MTTGFVQPDQTDWSASRSSGHTPRVSWRTWLVGRPLPTADAPHQAISKTVGLAVFSSDALSSTAYATQEIMMILAMAGASAFAFTFPIAIAIAILLAIVTISTNRPFTPTRRAAAPTSLRATTSASSRPKWRARPC